MTTDPDRPAVPGLEPADGRTHPLDMSKDPDRFDPDAHPRMVEPIDEPPTLDPAADPDRYLPPGQGQSLPELLGEERTHEGERDGYQWAYGLVGVFLFLALVAWVFGDLLAQ